MDARSVLVVAMAAMCTVMFGFVLLIMTNGSARYGGGGYGAHPHQQVQQLYSSGVPLHALIPGAAAAPAQPAGGGPAASASALSAQQAAAAQAAPSLPPPGDPLAECIDMVIPFHADDRLMFLDNHGLESIKRHVKGIRHIHVLSKSKDSFAHLLDERTRWFPESEVPFGHDFFKGNHPRPLGWMYQQALKFWAVLNIKGLCNQVLIMDSDAAFLKDLDLRTRVEGPPGSPPVIKYKYNTASMDSGAYEGDIHWGEYHHAVSCITGLPKALKETHTAIQHFQVMQRDVLRALEANLQVRGHKDIVDAVRTCAFDSNGSFSEYEVYFTWAWHMYRSRIDHVHLPYVLRNPKLCNVENAEDMKIFKGTDVGFVVCHDSLLSWKPSEILYTNCKQKGVKCHAQ